MALCKFVLSVLVACIANVTAQHAFRATSNAAALELAEKVARTELAVLLGHGEEESTARLQELGRQMKQMYDALPKNDTGSLDHGVARYALHRFFVQRHGWHVNGLEAIGAEKWGDASPTAMFKSRVPPYVLQMLEERLGGRLGLPELAIIAATLEDLVHSEAMQTVSTAFAAQNTSVEAALTEELENRMVETFLLFHVKPNPNYTKLSPTRINHILTKAPTFLAGWLDTLLWVNDVRGMMEHRARTQTDPFAVRGVGKHNFDSIVRLVETVGERYGQFQNLECRAMKNSLLSLEDRENGRVRLSKFYAPALDVVTHHPFGESQDYLRHLGALDETDPERPSVIVPNYLYSRSNCLASSQFYSICCINECEGLMENLEQKLARSEARPQEIVRLVAAIPSDTISAPRNLSAQLRRHLDEIADRHQGHIPIHGRLFAQWMHHAFPNECPYPHAPGTVEKPLRPKEWMEARAASNLKSRASKEDMQAVVQADVHFNSSEPASPESSSLPWTLEEELVSTEFAANRRNRSGLSVLLRLAVLLLAVVSAAIGLARMMKAPTATLPFHKNAQKASFKADWWSDASKSHVV